MKLTICVLLVLIACPLLLDIFQTVNSKMVNLYTTSHPCTTTTPSIPTPTHPKPAQYYYFNICGTAQICTQRANNIDSAACQMTGTNYFDCGHLKTATWRGLLNGVSGAQVTYKEGCCSKSIRQTTLILQCSTRETTVVSAGEIQPCVYAITVNSKLACPTNGTMYD
ncbi:hypothetical protein SAMD00019534_123430 [Acytostelium subglobosum LB1]|uniref:hypothetical protein n=1 Tax=Acytostelium subglobosum LB1 TaxID=1410327 RepID=UPI000644CB95|nr:hypothetical protein SAMD00019534_123430 [Acytostelium subglobosum LB1]GAM29167.1 hypothetical protein SAMD00019534_123430 [Acytostelium subglobosum LB1]|eukprot:XP_012747858.1 hypothetical protein SAMD00019534_123430 [Acytostelium subglobosum LB1]